MVNVAKIGQAGKFLFNRMRGVKYGGVKFEGGPVRLVETSKLKKLNNSLYDNHGEYVVNLNKDSYDAILRRTKPLQNGSNIKTNGENLTYLNVHGGSQIYDMQTKKPVMDICERLKNPIWTYIKNLF